jgi:hypothetical protein
MNAPARLKSVLFALLVVGLLATSDAFASFSHTVQNRFVKTEVFVAPPESGMFEESMEISSFDFDPFNEVAAVTMTNIGGSGSANSGQTSTLGSSLIDAVGNAEASMFAQAVVENEYGFGESYFETNFEVTVAGDYLFEAFALSAGDNFFSTDAFVQFLDFSGPLSFLVPANDLAVSVPLSLPAGEYGIIARARVDVTSNFDPEVQTSIASASFGVSLVAVPEPGTLALLAIGLFAMAKRRGR